MEGFLWFFAVIFILFQVYFAVVQFRIYEITNKMQTSILLLTVIANKLGATDSDVKAAVSSKQ